MQQQSNLPRILKSVFLVLSCSSLVRCSDSSNTERRSEYTVKGDPLVVLPTPHVDFGEIVGIATGPENRLFVLDGLERTVFVFNGKGGRVRQFGRKGRGPGELLEPAGILVDSLGRIIVIDYGNARFSFFDSAGKFLSSIRRASVYARYPWPGILLANGTLIDVDRPLTRDGSTRERLLWLDSDLDSVLQRAELPPKPKNVVTTYRGASSMSLTVPFSPTQFWRIDTNGDLFVVNSDAYDLSRRNQKGFTMTKLAAKVKPEKLSLRDRRHAQRAIERYVRRGGHGANITLPKYRPLHRGFLFDSPSCLWLLADQEDIDGTLVQVFTTTGEHLGDFITSIRLSHDRPSIISDSTLVTVSEDADGVHNLLKASIDRTNAALGKCAHTPERRVYHD